MAMRSLSEEGNESTTLPQSKTSLMLQVCHYWLAAMALVALFLALVLCVMEPRDSFTDELCGNYTNAKVCLQNRECVWCREAKYNAGLWGLLPRGPPAPGDVKCMSKKALQMSQQSFHEIPGAKQTSSYSGEVDGCYADDPEKGKELELSSDFYDLDICQNIPTGPYPKTWYTQNPYPDIDYEYRELYGIKCYASKEELLADKSWCLELPKVPDPTAPMPQAVRGLWWMHGVPEREIAFCSNRGIWDSKDNSLYVDVYKSWVFEDSPAGRKNAEELRKMRDVIKVQYEFEDDDKTKVKRAWITMHRDGTGRLCKFINLLLFDFSLPSKWGIRPVALSDFKGAAPEEVPCNEGDPDCFLRWSSGLAKFVPYYFRRLYNWKGEETWHAGVFRGDFTQSPYRSKNWSHQPIKTKFFRYTGPVIAENLMLPD